MTTFYGRRGVIRAAVLTVGIIGAFAGLAEPAMAAPPSPAPAATRDWHAILHDFAVAPRKAELEGFLRDLKRESENLRTL
jgi:hypothetical protein